MQELKQYHPYAMTAYIVVFIIMVTAASQPILQLLFFLISWLLLMEFSEVSIAKQVRLNVLMIGLAGISNPLFQHRGVWILFHVGSIPVTLEAIGYGLTFGCMLSSLMNIMKVYALMIHTDQMLYMINRISPNAALLCSLSMQQLSRMQKQYEDICYARSLFKQETSWWSKVQEQIAIVSSVLTWLMETGMDTSLSMRSRGFGMRKRSCYHVYRLQRRDILVLLSCLGFLLAYLAGISGVVFYWYPAMYQETNMTQLMICLGSMLFYAMLPMLLKRKEEAVWDTIISE